VKTQIRLIAILILLLACGCSTFNRDWRRAVKQPVDQTSPEGRWEGRWISESNGHNGKLRCLMSRESDSIYRAKFRATYAGILHFGYTARWEMHSHDIGWEFDGEADLGKMAGGVYYYEGRTTGTNLVSTYRSKYDHGRFEMHRP
jgi:hypothetical protein